MYRLTFLNGRLKGRRVAVQQGDLLIGRDPACQIDLMDDDQVSHRHVRLEQRVDGVWVTDLGAMNKTQVNGQPVDTALLKPGDLLEIGSTRLEYQPMESLPEGKRRRVSQIQVLTFVAIAGVFIVQGLFMLLQFARSPVSAPVVPVVAEPPPTALEPELQRAVALRDAEEAEAVAPTTGTAQSVDREVAELRAAVAGLRDQLDEMEPPPAIDPVAEVTPPPAVAPTNQASAEPVEEEFPVRVVPPPVVDRSEESPARPSDEDPLTTRAKQLLALAQQDIARSNLTGADQLLERIQVMAPDFLPAYVERANLYEKRAMLNKAGEQWALIMERSKGTPLYATATAVRQRLAQAEVAVSTTRKTLDERPVATRLPRDIRIVSVDRERFPSSKEFDEMRLVRVNLKPRSNLGDIDPDQFEVRAYFYDQVIGTGAIVPTGGTVPEQPLRLDQRWPAGEGRAVTATYILRKGFRTEEQKSTGEKRIYEGYRIQVYYRGELQDEDAQPRTLLKVDLPPPPAPTESSEMDVSAPVPLR